MFMLDEKVVVFIRQGHNLVREPLRAYCMELVVNRGTRKEIILVDGL